MDNKNTFLEMEYQKDNICKVLANGTYKGYEFVILNLGTHPTAYVKVPIAHQFHGKNYENVEIEVHGGLTYSDSTLRIRNDDLKGWWFGWDYAHFGDYLGYEEIYLKEFNSNAKKWTTKEIYEDVKDVINQLLEVTNA